MDAQEANEKILQDKVLLINNLQRVIQNTRSRSIPVKGNRTPYS